MSELRDLKIEGMGSCYGGTYNKVSIEGMTKIKDNIKCNKFSSEGMCKCEGSIEAEEMNIEGTFKSKNNIKTKSFNGEGIIQIKGASINANTITLEGIIKCEELSADIIDIEGICHVDKLFGDKIIINPTSTNVKTGFNLFFKPSDVSKANIIECTELTADLLTADIIRASRVKLGKDCEVNILEYSETADIHPEAKIKKLMKIQVR